MRIEVRVKTRSSRSDIIKNEGGAYTALLRSIPARGAANEELVELLSDKLGIAKSALKISKGLHSKNKIIEITDRHPIKSKSSRMSDYKD